MATLSPQILNELGFRELSAEETITGVFHSLHVYEVRGFVLDESILPPFHGLIANIPYDLAVGSSINDACKQLVSDVYTDDEVDWQKEHKCTPPYVLIHFGPTSEHSCTSGRVKEDESGLTTFDSFPGPRMELQAMASKVLPSLISALACSFVSHTKPVRFIPVDKSVFGVSTNGKTIHDYRLIVSATAYASTKITAEDISTRLDQTISIASQINKKVAGLFHLALLEEDPLKKFLILFPRNRN